jgi:membrane-bound lytic murein transglycosylase B
MALEVIDHTDHGRLDGDTGSDRALGPMQFNPSTWARYGVDASGDKAADPVNLYDAAAAATAAADYLCAAGGDLHPRSGQLTAVLAYNHSSEYPTTGCARRLCLSPTISATSTPSPAPSPSISVPDTATSSS